MQKVLRVLALLAGTLALCAGLRAETVLRAVMHAPLKLTDPHATTAYLPTWHGYMIYDTLLGLDARNRIKPQMLDKWLLSPDGKTYTMILRPGLRWHDGAPVTAADCVASIQRWARGDATGRRLLAVLERIESVDANTFRIVLKTPTDLVLRALSKPSGTTPFMMPRRVAATPLGQPITDMTGSGPFKIAAFHPGGDTVYIKNTDYLPRAEPASGLAGGKVVYVDKVEWRYMPDANEAVDALIAGRVDFIEQFPWKLLPRVRDNPELKVDVMSPVGHFLMYRFNFTQPPFNNKLIRQAAMYSIDQAEVLRAVVGDEKYWRTCASLWGCGTPYENDIGREMTVPGNTERARALLREARYDGTPVVILHATDVATLSPQALVMANALRRSGFNVALASMDWQTVAVRRASRAAPGAGGWNITNTNWRVEDIMDPLRSAPAAASGDTAWYGWPDIPAIEALRQRFALTTAPTELLRIAEQIQRIGIDQGLYVPLGQIDVPSVYSRRVSGLIYSPATVFWNARKQDAEGDTP
jgi:peptide/nickel transport system substrate-binding protein